MDEAGEASSMRKETTKVIFPAAMALLLAAAIFVPAFALAQPSESEYLRSAIQTASSAQTYASGVIDLASSEGLDVATAQASQHQGDTLLAAAQADFASGTNLSAGLTAAQAAARDFTAASSQASVALQEAGLTAPVEVDAAAGAVAATNVTVTAAGIAVASVCGGTEVGPAYETVFRQDCAQAGAYLSNASASILQAAQAVDRARVGASVDANLAAAMAAVVKARAESNQATVVLDALASFTYSNRVESFIDGPMAVASAEANSSVAAQMSIEAEFGTLETAIEAYAGAEVNATRSAVAAAQATSTALASVDTSSVVSSEAVIQDVVASDQSDLASLSSQVSAIGVLSGNTAQILSDIATTQTMLTAYESGASTVAAQADSLQKTALSGMGSYSNEFDATVSTVGSDGTSVTSAYARVESDLAALISAFPTLPILVDLQTTLNEDISATSDASANFATVLGSAAASISLASVQAGAMSSIVASDTTAISLNGSYLAAMAGVLASESVYLNATAYSALGEAAGSLDSAMQQAVTFNATAEAMMHGDVGAFSSFLANMQVQGGQLDEQASLASKSAAQALLFVQSDAAIRTRLVASAQALLKQSLQLFGEQDVTGGVAALLEASADLQAATGSSVPT
jgi:hypothetical protein